MTKETGHVKAVRDAAVDLGSGKNIIKNITKAIDKNLHLDYVFNNSIVSKLHFLNLILNTVVT